MTFKSWKILLASLCAGAVVLCAVDRSIALEDSNVLVLYNSASSDGAQIASHYSQVHPGVRTLGITGISTDEVISSNVYLNTIRGQVLAGLDSSIDCIVTTKGMPLRIDNPGAGGSWNRYSSLESELARVDSIDSVGLMGNQTYFLPDMWGGNSLAMNPYAFQDGGFSYQTYGTRLTSRLDGFSADDVIAAIDRAQQTVINRPGFCFLMDDDPNAPASPADRMEELADVLAAADVPYDYDGTDAFVGDALGPVLGYVSHGIYGGAPAGYVLDDQNGLVFDIAPGAAFHTWESFNAYSFIEGGNRNDQGLIAEWISRGGSAGTGHVEEPGVGATQTTNEDRVFHMLLEGYTWAEAAWNATLQLSYVNTVVGDPLMIYQDWTLGDVDLDGNVDAVDINAVKDAYGTAVGDPGYNYMADMDFNGCVDLWDLTFVKYHYTGEPLQPPNPEPATLLIVIVPALVSLIRRSRAGSS